MASKIPFQRLALLMSLLSISGIIMAKQPSMRDAAFQEASQKYFPMTPSEIHQFKGRVAEQEQANALPPGTPPKATSSVIPVSLKPGSPMQLVRVGQGLVSSLIFTDRNGNNWPIVSYTIGDSNSFHVNPSADDSKSPLLQQGILMIQGQKLYAQTNITVMLSGLETPVSLLLFIGQKSWDYQSYIRINKNGPGAKPGYEQTSLAPDYLMSFLNGVPPNDSQALPITGGSADSQLWQYKGKYILRTTATLMSPAYTAKVDGPGSPPVHVYQLDAAPSIMTSYHGNIENIQVSQQ